ncbi:MAG: FAD-binding oxidoreductase [Pseudomonadota bacterium]
MTKNLNAPNEADLEHLAGLAGASRSGADADPYLVDPRGLTPGVAALVLRPDTPESISGIVRYCADRRIGIVPYGGGTGLVGGQMIADGPLPVVLSLERMNRIRSVSVEEGAIIVEAGVTLAEVQRAAEEAGRLFPLSLASEGSCRIGGNLATNAGGTQVLRYGNARDLCLGIEAVLPSGEILRGLKTLRKDNTGYDLRHLLIGAEGSLGIITAAALKLFPRPAATVTAMLAIPDHTAAVGLLRLLQDHLGDQVTGFELIHGTGVSFVKRFFPETVDPLDPAPVWRVLAEVAGPDQEMLNEKAELALSEAFERELATDGVLASSAAQRDNMWWIRETIPECNRKVGAVSSHDISVPIAQIPDFIDDGIARLAAVDPALRLNCFGHIGDGNLHYNVFPPEARAAADFANRRAEVKQAIHDLVAEHGGSISAEHGIGRHKREDLEVYGDPAKLAAMRAIKQALDPIGIMNPGAVLA